MGFRGRNIYDPARRSQMPENSHDVSYTEELVTEVVRDNRANLAESEKNKTGRKTGEPTPVSLPSHQYIPANVPSLDFRRACAVPPGTTVINPFVLYDYTCPPGSIAIFTHYAIYCDGLDEDLVEFLLTVDGNRIFPYHGNPAKAFRMGLGLGADLSNVCLIPANLRLFPGQTLRAACVNLDPAVSSAMGVRFVGYQDSVNNVEAGRFGS